MKTRYGVSPWVHQLPDARRPAYSRYRGEHTADVVIIGGGLVGCALAYTCAVAGLRPVLLEADRVGLGSTGRGAGMLLPDPGRSFRDVAAAHGVRTARHVFSAWRHSTLEGAALLRKLAIPCGLRPVDLLLLAGDDEKALAREHETRREAGFEVTRLNQKQVEKGARLDASSAIRIKDGFALDPYRACIGVAAHAVRRGAAIFERSPVRKVRAGNKAVEIVAEGGTLRAASVVVATGVATAEFKPLRRHFKQRETYLALTEPPHATVRRVLGDARLVVRNMRTPARRLRWTPDHRLLVWGGDQSQTPPRTREAVVVQRTGQLMYELLTMYPSISGLMPEYGWSASYGETADGLMYIGAHRNYPRHLFALGGPPDSLTGAFLAGRVLLRAIQGRPEKGDDTFGWVR